MIIIALAKIAGIVLLGMFDHIAIIIALLFMFGIIVYVHVYLTGYWIYETIANRVFQKLFKKHNKENTHEAQERSEMFIASKGLLGIGKDKKARNELMAHKHIIRKFVEEDEEGNPVTSELANDEMTFQIETVGILLDEDIATFLGQGGLKGEHKTIIARVCLEQQLRIFGDDETLRLIQ